MRGHLRSSERGATTKTPGETPPDLAALPLVRDFRFYHGAPGPENVGNRTEALLPTSLKASAASAADASAPPAAGRAEMANWAGWRGDCNVCVCDEPGVIWDPHSRTMYGDEDCYTNCYMVSALTAWREG